MQLTGGQALARQLVLEGITDLFGIPGVQLDWAVDGLRQVSNRIRYIVPRHEQAASYMADGYARTTGRVGAFMVVPGPGLLNAMSGLATAYACNSKVLGIIGNIPLVGNRKRFRAAPRSAQPVGHSGLCYQVAGRGANAGGDSRAPARGGEPTPSRPTAAGRGGDRARRALGNRRG